MFSTTSCGSLSGSDTESASSQWKSDHYEKPKSKYDKFGFKKTDFDLLLLNFHWFGTFPTVVLIAAQIPETQIWYTRPKVIPMQVKKEAKVSHHCCLARGKVCKCKEEVTKRRWWHFSLISWPFPPLPITFGNFLAPQKVTSCMYGHSLCRDGPFLHRNMTIGSVHWSDLWET